MPVALDGLNRAQEAAVTHPGGPLLVAAGAGTGKTHTVVSRFVWLVDQGVPAERILALTFSAPAAAQMRERLEAVLDAPYEELHVETFRSFSLRLLQDEALEA
jgi:DNA helicase II / ATP-dependent DNA helicase PcrA